MNDDIVPILAVGYLMRFWARRGWSMATLLMTTVWSPLAAWAQPAPPPSACVCAPVAWWRADGNANDSIDSHHGTLTNGATFAAGEVGQAFMFDGINDFVTVPDSPSLRPQSELTLEGWISADATNGLRVIISKTAGSMTQKSYGMWIIDGVLNGTVSDLMHSGVHESVDYPLHPVLGQWYHVAYTFEDSLDLQKLYVNGSLVATKVNTNIIAYDEKPVIIGAALDFGTNAWFFGGRIDEFSLYARALSASEIQSIFLAGATGKDRTPPVISCPANTTASCATWQNTNITGTATATDNCDPNPAITFSDSVAAGSCNPMMVTRTWKATDCLGNVASCAQTINVTTSPDGTPPTITCPTNLTVECGSDTSPATTGSATGTDNCNPNPVITFTDTLTVLSCPNVRRINRVWKATDCAGNMLTCTQSITLRDLTAPVITCPPEYLTSCNGPTGTNFAGVATATDACDANPVVTFSDSLAGGPCPTPRRITRTWTATDACGNVATCQQIVTATDACLCSNPPPPPIAAWWKAEGNANDSAGSSHGTLVNGTTFAAGEVNQAFSLDGVDDYVSISDAPALRPANGLTIEGWFNFTATNGLRVMVAKTVGPSWPKSYALWLIDGVVYGSVSDGTPPNNASEEVAANAQLAAGQWYHVAYTYDDNADIQKIYVNGVLQGSGIQTNHIAYDGQPVVLGAAIDTGVPVGFLQGQIDEVTLYPQALSDADVNAIFTAGAAGKYRDTIPPLITCPTNRMADCNSWTNLSLMGQATASDNCDPNPTVSFSDSLAGGPCPTVVTRTWKAIDCSGYMSTCTQTITVVDTTAAPSIQMQPTNVTVTEPNAATFSVTATGAAPLSYQWRRGGVAIGGATSTSYTLNPTSRAADNGAQFDVVVTNISGAVTSMVATLTVNAAPPSIQTQPANVTVTEPNAATFSVTATGTAPLSYQWRRGGVAIGGATSTSYTLNPTSRAADNGAQFDVVVTNISGAVTSMVATLTVNAASPVPTNGLALWLRADVGTVTSGSALSQWTDQSSNGRNATQGTGTSQPTLVSGVVNGMPVVRFDGVNDFLTFTLPVNGLGGMTIFMVAANTQNQDGGDSDAERAALFWNQTAGWGTLFLSPFQSSVSLRFGTTQAENRITYLRPSSVGSAFTLTSAVKNGTTDSLYVNGTQVVNAGGKLATIAACQATGNVGRGYNNNTFYAGDIAEIVVYDRALTTTERQQVEQYLNNKYLPSSPLSPQITQQPMDVTVTEPAAASFSVVATGSSPLSYQWRRGGVAIAGATSASYVLSPTSRPADNGAQFDVVVSNFVGSVTSVLATLTVNAPTPPSIQTQPMNVTVSEPNAAMFSVTANGSAPLSYQWRRGGVPIGGATSSSYTLNPTSQASDNGAQFDVVVTNVSGMVTSMVATLTVNAPTAFPTNGLAVWLRSDAGTITSGSALSQWSDQTTNNRHATQGTASSQPTLVNGVINGLPVVRFDGVDDFLTFNLPVNGLGGMSMFLVAANTQNQNPGPSEAERCGLFWNESGGWGTLYLSPYQSSVSMRFGTGQLENRTNYLRPSSIGNAFTVSTAIKNGTTDSLYINGTQVVNAGGKLATITNCQSTGNIARGYNNNTFYAGDFAEVLVYTRALTPTERQQVEQVLNTKYALTASAAPMITQQPANTTVAQGGNATFNVTASGTGPLTYQWRFGGGAIGGAIASSYTVTNAQPAQGGSYQVVVSNSFGSVTSMVATLTVNPASTPPTNGLALWLRSDAGVVTSGSAVSQWSDQTTNNRHATQGTASSRPTLVNGVINGLPVVRFDGVDDFLTFSLTVNGLGGMSVFLVAANTQNQNPGPSGAERCGLFWNESGGWGTLYLSPYQSSVSMRFGTGQAENRTNYVRSASVGSAFTLSTALKNGTTDSLYINGTQVVNAGGKLATIANCQSTGNVGRGYNNNTFYAGDMAEILVYTRALTTMERQQVEQILITKYGLTAGSGGAVGPPVLAETTSRTQDGPQITSIGIEPDGVRLNVAGQPGESYQVEASEDLTHWTAVGTATANPSGSFEFFHPTDGSGAKFYRVATAP